MTSLPSLVPAFCRCTLLSLAILTLAGSANAQCRQALALGLDVSGSVDSREYRLQMDGLAAALTHPDVSYALLANPSAPIHLAVFEWSGSDHQHILQDWVSITDAEVLARFVALLRDTKRHPSSLSTSLGTAMLNGAALLDARPACWKRTLDISGDGINNTGPHPRAVQKTLSNRDITINALVIGADAARIMDQGQDEIGELSSYFKAYVKTGPRAFVETALGFEDYEAAMVRKLQRELVGPVLSFLDE